MQKVNPKSARIKFFLARFLVVLLAVGLMSDLPAAHAVDPTFTVPTSPIAVNEQTPSQVFPGLTFVDSGTNYSGGWIEYAIDTATAADLIFLETATVADTSTSAITVSSTFNPDSIVNVLVDVSV